MNDFLPWCLVPFPFHDLTSLHPLSFHKNDFPLVKTKSRWISPVSKVFAGAEKAVPKHFYALHMHKNLLPYACIVSDSYLWRFPGTTLSVLPAVLFCPYYCVVHNVRWPTLLYMAAQGCQIIHNCLLLHCLELQKQPLVPEEFYWPSF